MAKWLGAVVLTLAACMAQASELRLLMVERVGCDWCAEWNRAIAPVYPKTPEGAQAPLARVMLDDFPPDGVAPARPVRFTPTFLLLRDGAETGRIEGYPGEDFFWGLLSRLLEAAGTDGAGDKTP